jgi:integrase
MSAELPPIRLHDLRHSYPTIALCSGVHPKIVSSQLKHHFGHRAPVSADSRCP